MTFKKKNTVVEDKQTGVLIALKWDDLCVSEGKSFLFFLFFSNPSFSLALYPSFFHCYHHFLHFLFVILLPFHVFPLALYPQTICRQNKSIHALKKWLLGSQQPSVCVCVSDPVLFNLFFTSCTLAG